MGLTRRQSVTLEDVNMIDGQLYKSTYLTLELSSHIRSIPRRSSASRRIGERKFSYGQTARSPGASFASAASRRTSGPS